MVLTRTHPDHRSPLFIFRRVIVFALLAGSCALLAFQPAADKTAEYRLKAAFIYNFMQYIDWGAATPPDNVYVIGILGNSAIDDPLNEITKSSRSKQIVIKHFRSPEDIGACQVLFIPKETAYSTEAILSKVGKGTLTVAESPGMCRKGAAMNFVVVDNKLKFETNIKAITAAGLKASSQLLKLAIIAG